MEKLKLGLEATAKLVDEIKTSDEKKIKLDVEDDFFFCPVPR